MILYGYCKCGCGEKTRISERNQWRDGKKIATKGEPKDFIRGHSSRLGLNAKTDKQEEETRERARETRKEMLDDLDTNIEYGLCQCGCERKTPLAGYTHTSHGYVEGEPVLFINGHSWSGKKRNQEPEYIIDKKTGCWVWQGSKVYSGPKRVPYGRKTYRGTKVMAHRYYWEVDNGPIAEGTEIDHLCTNTLCVNPNHLDIVNHTKNVRRGNNTKLTLKEVEHIRKLLNRGCSHRKVAEIYKVSNSTIDHINAGRSWTQEEYSQMEGENG